MSCVMKESKGCVSSRVPNGTLFLTQCTTFDQGPWGIGCHLGYTLCLQEQIVKLSWHGWRMREGVHLILISQHPSKLTAVENWEIKSRCYKMAFQKQQTEGQVLELNANDERCEESEREHCLEAVNSVLHSVSCLQCVSSLILSLLSLSPSLLLMRG